MGWGLRRDVSGTRPEAAGGRRERRAGGRGPGAAAWGGGEIAPAGASGGGPGGTGAWTSRGLRPPCSHGPREAGVRASRAPQIGHLPSARRTRRAKPRALRARGRALGAGRPPQRRGLRCAGPVARSRRRGEGLAQRHLWLGAFGPQRTSTACPEGSAGAGGRAGRPGRPRGPPQGAHRRRVSPHSKASTETCWEP